MLKDFDKSTRQIRTLRKIVQQTLCLEIAAHKMNEFSAFSFF